MNSGDLSITILQAADYLQVTDKTIRNYISRGILHAGKWNGSWRIERSSLREVYWKRNGIPPDKTDPSESSSNANLARHPDVIDPTSVALDTDVYGDLQKRSGRLELAEKLVEQLQSEEQKLRTRIEKLEASAASAWTEARALRSDLESAKTEKEDAQKKEAKKTLECELLSRELHRIRTLADRLDSRLQESEAEQERFFKNTETSRARSDALRGEYREFQGPCPREGASE